MEKELEGVLAALVALTSGNTEQRRRAGWCAAADLLAR
jgi:hypothetical protein